MKGKVILKRSSEFYVAGHVPKLALKILVEGVDLEEAVAQAAVLGGQQFFFLHAHEAVLGALGHGLGGHLIIKLLGEVG
jgi:hypothetical protein